MAERAKRAPGTSSVGVRTGREREEGGFTINVKVSHCVEELEISKYICGSGCAE